MELVSFLVVICLLIMAVLFTGYLGFLIYAPLRALIQGGRDSGKVRRASQIIGKVDALIDQGKSVEALNLLRRAVVFDFAHSTRMVSSLKDHHQNVLSRCLLIAEEVGSRPRNLAAVEKLLIERTELQTLFLKAADSYQNVRYRRERAGKNLPHWSKAEFEQRISEIKKELARNQKELEAALRELFDGLAKADTENIVYH